MIEIQRLMKGRCTFPPAKTPVWNLYCDFLPKIAEPKGDVMCWRSLLLEEVEESWEILIRPLSSFRRSFIFPMETRECIIIVDDQDLIWESTKETAEKNTKQIILWYLKEIYTKFPDLLDAKKEKNMRKKKKNSYKTIFMWFGNLPMSTELHKFH